MLGRGEEIGAVDDPSAYVSVAERSARGRAARAGVPRGSQSAFEPAPDRDPIGLLEAQDVSRLPELVPIRYGRMLASPLAFFRGSAAIMAHDLASTPQAGFSVQLCGDAHLSNFGGYASPDRTLVFDLNDFDETAPGPFEWDVKRLATSFEICARERGLTDTERRALVLGVMRFYREAMSEFARMGDLAVWYSRLDASVIEARLRADNDRNQAKSVQRIAAKAQTKDNLKALAKLTHVVDGRVRIVSDPPLIVPIEELAADGKDAAEIEGAIRELFRSYRRSLQQDRRKLLEGYRVVDVARKVVGVGSVGRRTWIVLLLGRDDSDPLFLQIKEAEASVLEPHLGKSEFENHGQRVVEGQRMMQAASDLFLGWLREPEGVNGEARDLYVRQLWDWKTSVNVDTILPKGLGSYAEACGWTLGRAHARSGDRIAIAAYLGKGDVFDRAVAELAEAYADLNARDHAALMDAVRSDRIKAEAGV